MDKRALRQELIAARARVPSELTAGWSAAAAARLGGLDEWTQAAVVHCFVGALAGEVRTEGLLARALAEGRRLVCPRVMPRGRLEHREVTVLTQLENSSFGLREPSPALCPQVDAAEVDLVVVPGVGFSRDGLRLGMGGGYYDRFLSTLPPTAVRVGLAFELQLLDAVPSGIEEQHDERVDLIVTELRVRRCR